MITEKEYCSITDISHRKKFAQFFTPYDIADFMAEWVIGESKQTKKILEPAFGLISEINNIFVSVFCNAN